MIFTKKYRHKPVYKKFVKLNENVQNKQKLFKFKKVKWQRLLSKLKRESKFKKRNCYYKFYNKNFYYVSKFSNYFSNNYKINTLKKRSFLLLYGELEKRYLKKCLSKSIKKSNKVNNSINTEMFFNSFLELRLDIILFKSKFVLSVKNARQLIIHGHVSVNGKVVKDNSFLVKTGDKIKFDPKIHTLIQYYILKSESWPIPPENIQVSYSNLQIRIIDNYLSSSTVSRSSDLTSVIDFYKVK